MSQPTLSICMIVKNEADNLPRCLKSLEGVADQIVVVDTGSTDRTAVIAKEFGAEVYAVSWENSFSAARNASLAKACCDWILIVDGDDEFVREDIPQLKKLMLNEKAEGYFFQTISVMGGDRAETEVMHPTMRMFRNRPFYRYQGRIHESVLPSIIEYAGREAILTAEVRFRHSGYLRTQVKEKNKSERNLEMLKMEIEEQGEKGFLLYNMGVEYLRLGEDEKALEYFNKAEKDMDPRLSYASSLVRKKADCLANLQLQDAIDYLLEKTGQFPDYTDLVYQLGLFYLEQRKYAAAIEMFYKCLELGDAPKQYLRHAGTGGHLPCLLLGSIYEQIGESEKALQAYRRALTFNPHDLKPLYRIVAIIIGEYGIDAVTDYLETFFELATPAAKLSVAEILLHHWYPQHALGYLREAADSQTGRERFQALYGSALLLTSEFKQAQVELEKVPANSSHYSAAAQDLCLLSWKSKRYEVAEKLIKQLPEKAQKLYQAVHRRVLGMGLGDKRGNQAASEAVGFSLQLLEKSLVCGFRELTEIMFKFIEDSKELEAAAGKMFYRRREEKAARFWLERSLASGSQDTEVALLLARILHNNQERDPALKLLRQALTWPDKDLEICLEMCEILRQWAMEITDSLPEAEKYRALLDTDREPVLSLCMIVRDEAHRLARCLQSVQGIIDEIIVVDTGSEDNSAEIAAQYGARVFTFPWKGDFSAARNFALDQAKGDWILVLDADEVLHPEDRQKIRPLLQVEQAEGYCLQVQNYYGNQAGSNYMTDMVCRLFRNRPSYRFRRSIHEQVVDEIIAESGSHSVKIANVRLKHYGYLAGEITRKNKAERNLTIIREAIKEYPEDKFLRYSLGVELLNQGNYADALTQLESAYRTGTGYSSDIALKMIVCLKEMGKEQKALELINDVQKEYPTFTDLLFLRGEILLDKQQYSEAIACFEQCLEMGDAPVNYCGTNGIGGFRSHYYLGRAYQKQTNYEKAEMWYRRALADNPRYYLAFYALAEVLRQNKSAGDAADYLKKCLENEEPASLLLLADVFLHTGDYETAWQLIAQSEPIPGNADRLRSRLNYLKKRCLTAMGRKEEPQALPAEDAGKDD
ncbi:glycosyltransferase [Dethiobacter alkaliphilus]|uniref:glycosyltransferase n=1 Tax=Dethiobacter alkaliphilus TaxID=427926 RepID=UPI0022265779|nr:glycosyltransferase [Dethiobacter alkaliphilus]MCW3489271.1 glycosyltransferase [Dethiobacter alkaliphilus]